MSGPLDEVAFLANSANRLDVLRTLASEPHTRRELVDATDASRPTVGRILDDFEDRSWVARTGRQYELTSSGRLVTDAFLDLLAVVETERALRAAVAWLPTERIGFDIEQFADADVSVPEPGYSHRPVNRFVELVADADADSARGFGVATLAPMSAETLLGKARAGTDVEIIYPRAVLEEILLSNAGAARDAMDRGTLTPMVHEELPCGLYVLDDRVVLGGYDDETGVLRVVVDTANPDAVEWADALYARYRREAEPFEPDGLRETERDGRDATRP
jgi:predicted transcriptional regulator